MKFKALLSSVLVMGAVALFSACSGSGSKEVKPAPMGVDAFETVAADMVGDTVEVSGLCTHLCKHGGTKAFLQGEDTTVVLRCNAGEAFGSFSPDCVGKKLIVKGIVAEDRIGEAEIAEMEKQLAAADSTQKAEGHNCATDAKAQGQNPNASQAEKIASYRKQIEERMAKEGKNYLSFFYIDAIEYSVQTDDKKAEEQK